MTARASTGRGAPRLSHFAAGLIALALVAAGTYLAFAQRIPLTGGGFELKAVVSDAGSLGPRSPVRIAGVEVGRVKSVEPLEDAAQGARVTMEIDDRGLPVHADAELEVRPRIFLEGNVFVDLRPGTSAAPELEEGDTIPASQTTTSVQLGQVLDILTHDIRGDARALVQGFGGALSEEPTSREDRTQDRAVRGETAGESLNDSIRDAEGALRGQAVVSDALLGTEPGDLARFVSSQSRVARALVSREEQLKDLVGNLNTTLAAFAAREGDLRDTIRLLPEVLDAANPALARLNDAFPPTRAFAREAIPSLRETPATIEASTPWIAQMRRLLAPSELQGLVRQLRPATRDLAAVTDSSVRLLPQIDLINRCLIDIVLPTGDVVVEDPPLTTGIENYKEFWQALVGLAGESQNFDGNGSYTRFQTGGGTQTVSTGDLPGTGPLFGNAPETPLGVRPVRPARRPPYRPDVPCHTNQPPDINSAQTGPGP